MDAKQLIGEIVEKQGITRYKLAKELDVEPSAVYHWESGRKKPNGTHLLELLRRAGRLAAMVTMGAIITAAAVPNDATAAPTPTEKPFKFNTLCIM